VNGGAEADGIEDIILSHDRRGIAALRRHLPADFCARAARLLTGRAGPVLIATGFYTDCAGFPETDGPPGALCIGRALGALGVPVRYVTDEYSAPLLTAFAPNDECVRFPMGDDEASARHAAELLERFAPAALIAVERCGSTADGSYLTMRGRDISARNARIDHLFLQHPRTVGIGDGGNEIGMGRLAHVIPDEAGLPAQPCATPAAHLIIASVSNWGAYGLVAALSCVVRRDLLPQPEEEEGLIARMVAAGAVDGISGERTCSVDGFTLEENGSILARLRDAVLRHLQGGSS